jgi:hypothetical protein
MASTRCYLNHRYEASRAQFFRGFGFQAEAWETFAAALRERGQQNEVTLTKEAGFRPRYEVEGELAAPDSRRPQVRTVWAAGCRPGRTRGSPLRIFWNHYDQRTQLRSVDERYSRSRLAGR